jgi:hypothetical protein
MTPVTSITVTINESDLADFLAGDNTEEAMEQYRAEYERRLSEMYEDAECSVELGQTSMSTEYRINGEPTDAGSGEYQDEIPFIDDIANRMVNDWSWLTV